jgi:RNA polymerase sigma-70 factor (ECF subfamily)
MPDLDCSEPDRETSVSDPWEETSDQRDLVNRALAGLPQRQAAALIGKYVSGYSVEELANHMRSTPKAVESLLSRARAAFRAAFQALHDSGSGGKNHD